jgi:hypothetical protein
VYERDRKPQRLGAQTIRGGGDFDFSINWLKSSVRRTRIVRRAGRARSGALSSDSGLCGSFGSRLRCGTNRSCKQSPALEVANFHHPARPWAIRFDAELESNELRELKSPLGIGKFANPKMALRVRRVRERETVFVHGQLDIG